MEILVLKTNIELSDLPVLSSLPNAKLLLQVLSVAVTCNTPCLSFTILPFKPSHLYQPFTPLSILNMLGFVAVPLQVTASLYTCNNPSFVNSCNNGFRAIRVEKSGKFKEVSGDKNQNKKYSVVRFAKKV